MSFSDSELGNDTLNQAELNEIKNNNKIKYWKVPGQIENPSR